MKENLTLAWVASWCALVGQLVFFIGVAFFTGEWRYILWSFIASMMAGVPCMMLTWKSQKKANLNQVNK
ncbi:hypothetical protein [Alkalihalobacillus sp. TS-13]|uniref:hypothetical protein n=1 Tax=Alkalihalobacillus sp. TS-13 TaxID=2842455 RepID=UPI001C88882F|nr:hypothetical protein [Alkalihalobacillus sp. TS-13]